MSSQPAAKKLTKKVSFAHVHRFMAAVSLIIFLVIIIGGISAEVRLFTITLRAAIALLCVSLIGRVVMRIIASYEEMNGGQT